MTNNIEFSTAASDQIEKAVCQRLERIRLSRNITQKHLAEKAGVSLRTIRRMEKGEGTSLDTFIRALIALGIQGHLETFLPDPTVRPMDRIRMRGRERMRARPTKVSEAKPTWSWGDGQPNDE